MPTERFTEGIVLRGRRFSHLAVLRLCLALAYLGVEVILQAGQVASGKLIAASLFTAYSTLLLFYRTDTRVRGSAGSIQFTDLICMVVLMLLSDTGEVALPLLMFYFLLIEATLLHGVREVLIVTMVSLVFYAGWLSSGEARRFQFSYNSFMFLLIAGGALAYYFSKRQQRTERRIAETLRQAAGEPEARMVQAVESALESLTRDFHCSRAILSFWDASLDYHAICQYPPQREPSQLAAPKFDDGREWSCFRGSRLDLYVNDVSLVDQEGKPLARDFDLHPYVIQKFEIYNALGCGLWNGDHPIGRLLLINSVSEVHRNRWKKLQEVVPPFRELVRQLLVVKNTEQEAYERERGRIAHDLHDGPLQTIISFEMRIEIIRRLLERGSPDSATELDSLHELSRKLVSEMRTFVHRMRPLEAEDASLMASARRLVDGFEKESGVSVTFVGEENGARPIRGKLGTEILQVAREALHNIYKHAEATHVLFAVEEKGNRLHLSVDDNGRGFRFGGKYTLDELERLRLGPKSIKRRVRALGGDLLLESHPGQGSNLRVTLPLY